MKNKHIYLILCFLWMGVIFWFSHQVADDSQSMSNDIIFMIEDILHIDIMRSGGWLLDTVSFIVRKAAHMSEYALLAILFSAYFKACGKKNYWMYALVCVVFYASSDEVHQLFVEGRSGQWMDVCIDSIGGSMGLILQAFYWKIKTYRKTLCTKGRVDIAE